jgi:nucleotide-binding universal stress UspA family protein
MKRIVVGVDGSEPSERALRWAVEEAAAHGADLVAVHAWNEQAVASSSFGAVAVDPTVYQEAAREVLDGILAGVGGDVRIEGKLLEGGASRAILEEARTADLVVVGTRGRGGFAGLLLGSVSHQVVHHATCPVVVVPPPAD